jgi:hypothetical protein
MLAEVRCCCGRTCLFVAGIVLAMEGDRCRSNDIPEEVLEPVPEEELRSSMAGLSPAMDIPVNFVRFFLGDNWTPRMLQWSANRINESAAEMEVS